MRKSIRPPRVSESTTYRQKSKSSSTSIASWVSPSRLERTDSPARSRVVKIRPIRPRAAWLWLVWRARVLLPESIVPVKNWSSAIGEDHAMQTADPLISVGELAGRLGEVTVLDVRYQMGGPTGRAEYEAG